MPAPRIVHLRSLEELRAAAGAWDHLWRRSETTYPTLRAEHIAQWIGHFSPRAEFLAVAVEENGRFTAALPLLERKIARVFRGGAFPCNEWSSSGDLLWDAGIESDESGAGRTLDALFAALAELPISLLWLDEILPESRRWNALLDSFKRHESTAAVRPRWQAGRVEIGGDWRAYRSSWSRKHRQNTARCIRQLSRGGELQLRLLSDFAPGEAARWMRRGWEIENLGWKGAAGSSVLQTPGMEAYYSRQAELLAQDKQLELAFLESAGRPVAFAYGQTAKGVFHSVKIGYDPSFADYSPGQLLRYFLLERFHREEGRKALDFLGPLTDSHAAWQPKTYSVARLAASLGGLAGKLAVAAYRRWR
jgi:CelD/BcsL family acetyltransferase involved in cellulose biosynthesis